MAGAAIGIHFAAAGWFALAVCAADAATADSASNSGCARSIAVGVAANVVRCVAHAGLANQCARCRGANPIQRGICVSRVGRKSSAIGKIGSACVAGLFAPLSAAALCIGGAVID